MSLTEPQVYNKQDGINGYPCWAIYIGRPSKWGNPFVIGRDGNRKDVIKRYEAWLETQPKLKEEMKKELRGKDLLCYCSPLPCHGDVILRIANEPD